MATYWSDMCWRETYVYRAYIDDELAYVGLTMNPDGRFSQHRSNKPWWKRVTVIELELFKDRESAKAAERAAIRDERPIFNNARPASTPRIVVR